MLKRIDDILTADLPVNLQTLVDSHDKPFVVINRDYIIVAANRAYREVFQGPDHEVIGKTCYEVSHNRSEPCHRFGENCPYNAMFSEGRHVSCLHVHNNGGQHECRVRVNSCALKTCDGELLMGELIEELPKAEEVHVGKQVMVGRSKPFMHCVDELSRAACTDATVLLLGETGTGKELAAHHVHSHSRRADRPFVVMDCTAIPETLFESEVFGHERGAFTGSVGDRGGLFEQADGGTLFMDEVGELPLALQSKLLRVLETGKLRRVGSNQLRDVNARVVCATNRDLMKLVAAGQFREDLYYRVACLTVRLPPLRERMDDIDVLAPTLLGQISSALDRDYRLTGGAIDWLKHREYLGNVRELRNILLVAASRSSGNVIYADCINEAFALQQNNNDASATGMQGGAVQPADASAQGMQAGSLSDLEAQYITGLLDRFANNRKRVAAEMGISERTLYRKIKRYSLA